MEWILYKLGLKYWFMYQWHEGVKLYYIGNSRWVEDINKCKRFKKDPSKHYKYFAYWHQSEMVNKLKRKQ